MNQQSSSLSTLPSRRPLIYLITDRTALHQNPSDTERSELDTQLAIIAAAVAAGCSLIQIRERDLDSRQLADFVRRVVAVAHKYHARVLVNDRLDVALSAGADGVHLRASSISASEARLNSGHRAGFLIGASTHSLAEALTAAEAADFVVLGPVYETQSKSRFGPPLGITAFAEIAAQIPVPVLAIGGITLDNFAQVLECGAAGIAGIGLFSRAEGLEVRIQRILDP